MKERLSPPSRKMSGFMFEQRIFDFANKNLDPYVYKDMKRYMEEHHEAREKVGAVLLAFEYFNSISEIKIEYDETLFLNIKKSFLQRVKRRLKQILVVAYFLFLFAIILICFEDMVTYFEPKFYELQTWISHIIGL